MFYNSFKSVKLEEIKKKEIEILKLQSAPLRVYLVKNVMPTITEGLIEVCKVRPQDPVDFLVRI
jgi:adenylate kinase